MRIAVIGAGNVGSVLADRWSRAGREVIVGVRTPDDRKYSGLSRDGLVVTGVKEAVQDAGVVVLATPWAAAREVLENSGDLKGKVLVDCTNPLKPSLDGLTHDGAASGAELVAQWASGADVVKAFNTVGANIMEDPGLEGRRAAMFICGSDRGKSVVRELSDLLGFETIDAGPLERASLLESFALLWITAAFHMGLGREFAFSIIRREAING